MKSISIKIMTGLLLFAFASHATPSNAKSAMAEASAAGQFLCLVFYDAQDASLTGLSSSIAAFKKSSAKKISVYKAILSDPVNMEVGGKYGVKRGADLPLVLVFAPNGAITGGYPKTVTADQLKQSVSISDLILKTIKPLQEQKVALVALQNTITKFNEESWQGVSDFANNAQYKEFVTAIKADPEAAGSQEFVKQCQLIQPLTEATVVVLMPPGKIAKILNGKITKDDILKSLQSCKAGSGCCSDRKFKQNITPIDSALEKVAKLQGVTFTWNRTDYPRQFFCEGKQMGLIAQEVETVIPEVVLTDKEGFKSVAYDKLTAVLIEAVKELNKKLTSQDSIIKMQSAQIKALVGKK
jgi:hypothetical protein